MINEKTVNEAVKVLTVFMSESKIPYMKAEVFSNGEFYIIETRIRKVKEDE